MSSIEILGDVCWRPHAWPRRAVCVALTSMALSACSRRQSLHTRDANVMALQSLEEETRGRLGACVLDTATGWSFGWREHERFAHCSSFKLSLTAMLLARSQTREVDLDEVLRWQNTDLLPVSPITSAHVATGLDVRALARATLVTSDNTAANVLLRRFGGPPAMTAFWRSLGDEVSRLDRYEPELNQTPPGTELDTTSPAAMATTTAALVHGAVLSTSNRALLKAWMTEVRTGAQRVRAGFPDDWESGDKTGTGVSDTRQTYVDLAFGGPAGRSPLIVSAFFEPAQRVAPMDPAALKVLAQVGRIAAQSRAR
jgi:beta-lactamase class A